MQAFRPLKRVATPALAIALAACGSGSGPSLPTPQVAKVTVTAPSTSVKVGDSVRATATALDAHGTTVTGVTVTWSSSAQGVATVDANGTVHALQGGDTKISAVVGSATGTLDIHVTP
ncbi:MAG TPA: Ig-like domain-containing protein [Gemmatimonadaceae bacterium]|jgi:uncharacterized protein YjdB|nr:Ig-like domain-containing protein [Gemmatimonadaceae bacterium]